MWDHKRTLRENLECFLGEYWLLLGGVLMAGGALLYRPYGADMQFLMDFLPGLGGFLLFIGLLKLWSRPKRTAGGKRNPVWVAYNVCLVFLLIWACSVGMVVATLLSEMQRNPVVQGLDVIVLGVELSAQRDQVVLDSRLKSTAYYMKQYPQSQAVLCGGAAPGETLTTASYMQDYLLSQGISAQRLHCLPSCQTVPQAIDQAKAWVLDSQGGTQQYPVGLIANEYQLYRARKEAAAAGLEVAKMCVRTPLVRLIPVNFFLREYFRVIPLWLGIA